MCTSPNQASRYAEYMEDNAHLQERTLINVSHFPKWLITFIQSMSMKAEERVGNILRTTPLQAINRVSSARPAVKENDTDNR